MRRRISTWQLMATFVGSIGTSACDSEEVAPSIATEAYSDSGPLCEPLASDYTPGAEDAWPACPASSDTGEYVLVGDPPSTTARVEAFEELGPGYVDAESGRVEGLDLFEPTSDPTPEAFAQAAEIYTRENGLASRVDRRYDPHFGAPATTDCGDPAAVRAYPSYCVGPAKLRPIISGTDEALDDDEVTVADGALRKGLYDACRLEDFASAVCGAFVGAQQAQTTPNPEAPRVSAARMEAALLWFLYASQYKESLTCTDTARDCDSAYAYYTGARDALVGDSDMRGGIGLARYVREANPEAHMRAWDGLLAVRCWRELDSADVATDHERRDLARNQFDRAVLAGVISVLRERAEALASIESDRAAAPASGDGQSQASDDERAYLWAFLQTLTPAVLPAALERDEALADELETVMAREAPQEGDAAQLVQLFDALNAC